MNPHDQDFARRQEQQRSLLMLTKTKPEWHVLKRLVSQFALENQGIGKNRFKWSKSMTGQPRLSLGSVAATFLDRGERDGVPQHCKVLFSCEDAFGAHTPLSTKTWSLIPDMVSGQFGWTVRETGAQFSSPLLADEIATELTRYHLSYEKQFQKAVSSF